MSRGATALATVPQPCRVLGTALRPFCLGHRLLLKRLRLPFAVDPKASATPQQIMHGIAVCAASYNETLDALLDGSWPGLFERWQRKVFGPKFWRRKWDVALAEKLFREHLKRGNEEPPVWKYKVEGISLSAPWEELLKCRLVMAGFSESEVMNGYLPMRWYDFFTVTEIKRADKLQHTKDWKPVFYTEKNAAAMNPQVESEANPHE